MAATPVLAPGYLLAGRYRLTELFAEGPHTVLWRASDEVLARPVAVKLLPAAHPRLAEFLQAAALAGTVSHPGLCRVYDAAQESLPGGGVGYVVSEWVSGRSLPELLADGPLPPEAAGGLGVEAAEAVAAAHARQVWHGRLHPGNLLVSSTGRVRVTDVAVAAALHGPAGADPVAADTRDLGALVFAALTGRWPRDLTPQPAAGLPVAPRRGTEPYRPRQLRAGVPRALDEAVATALAAGNRLQRTPADLAAALVAAGARSDALAASSEPPVAAPPAVRTGWLARGSRLRRALPWALSAAFLLAVGLGAFAFGQSVGQLPGRSPDVEALAQPTPKVSVSPGGPVLKALDLTAPGVSVRDFDPFGDGTENHSTVVNATDKDPSTAWATEGYRTPDLGGVKPGVGLLVDLGRPTVVRRVEVALTTDGATVELHAGETIPARHGDPLPPLVASVSGAGKLAVLTPGPATGPARYWIVWFTKLPADPTGNGYREGVAELALFH